MCRFATSSFLYLPMLISFTLLQYVKKENGFSLSVYMDNRYCHVYCQVLPGEEAKDLPSTSEGYGHDDRFITKKVDFLSAQRSPQWLDEPVVDILIMICNVYKHLYYSIPEMATFSFYNSFPFTAPIFFVVYHELFCLFIFTFYTLVIISL